jgi:alginate O-acetyltransferase complex protein AlgI
MIFTDKPFLIFAFAFFPLYFATRGSIRNWLTLIASYIFYGWWDWRWCGLLFLTTFVDYWSASFISQSESERVRKFWIVLSVSANLLVLAIFKYFDFFVSSGLVALQTMGLHADTRTLGLVLPIGISFYTFQSMSYTIDVYRREVPAERNFVTFATCVAIFPHLVAGPIIRASRLIPQVKIHHAWSWPRVVRGLEFVVWGVFLKTVLADNLAPIVDSRFGHYADFGSAHLVFGVFAFAFQIYGDFAGYSLIAIGLGKIMGLSFGRNFNRPYFAADFSDFWRRWHISLSSWLRDYLYISLGGNRFGALFTFRNLMVTMLLGGLWHGANWTFVIWGALHGSFLIAQRMIPVQYLDRMPRPARILIVFILVCIAWVFFRAASLADALQYLGRIATFDAPLAEPVGDRVRLALPIFAICFVLCVDCLSINLQLRASYLRSPAARFVGAAALVWLIILLGRFDAQAFIYFQF